MRVWHANAHGVQGNEYQHADNAVIDVELDTPPQYNAPNTNSNEDSKDGKDGNGEAQVEGGGDNNNNATTSTSSTI